MLLVIARLRGVALFERDGTLGPGLAAGVLFGFEFVLIYHGLLLTTASRAVVFLYTAPFFVALGSSRILGEGCARRNGAASRSASPASPARSACRSRMSTAACCSATIMIVGGGALWAATTLLVKASSLISLPPEKTLIYQVAVSIPILGLAAWAAGETLTRFPEPLALSLMAYQAGGVVGLTFLIFFSMV